MSLQLVPSSTNCLPGLRHSLGAYPARLGFLYRAETFAGSILPRMQTRSRWRKQFGSRAVPERRCHSRTFALLWNVVPSCAPFPVTRRKSSLLGEGLLEGRFTTEQQEFIEQHYSALPSTPAPTAGSSGR